MQCHGKLDNPQIGSQMSARLTDIGYKKRSYFLSQLFIILGIYVFNIIWFVYFIQQIWQIFTPLFGPLPAKTQKSLLIPVD
jgi:hypothetical protein